MRRRRRHGQERHVDLPPNQIRGERAGPFVGNVRDEDAALALEQLGRQVQHAAVTCRAVVELTRVRLGMRQQLLERVGGHRIGHGQYQWHRAHHGDGSDVLERIKRHAGVDGRVDDVVGRHQRQGLPVLGRAHHLRRA